MTPRVGRRLDPAGRDPAPGNDPNEVKTMTATKTPPAEPALIDVKAMAGLLGCSSRHVTRLEEAGQLPPAVKLGRLSRWNREAVQKWLADGCPPVAAKTA